MTNSFDSIIFDMDGTLWDAVDSYCKIWDTTFNQLGIKQTVSRDELLKCMGMPIHEIFNNIANTIINIDEQHFLNLLDKNEREMMPILGGKLYTGVYDGIKLLSDKYKLYMVSNCGADGLKNFLSFTQLKPYFYDTLTHGETNLSKADNITNLIERNNLNSAIYVGDTQSDCNAAHKAGIPMIFAKYGFGECENAEYTIESFSDLLDLLFKNLYK
jgi:phosphoglycolate phosphatase